MHPFYYIALALALFSSSACQHQPPPVPTTVPAPRPIALAAIDSDAVIQRAATQLPALQKCLLFFNQTQAHKEFRAEFQKIGPTKRLIVLRYLILRGGYGQGQFEASFKKIEAAAQADWLWSSVIVIYENQDGWGYLTNTPDALGKDAMLGSMRIVSGHAAGFIRHPKDQSRFEKLFDESLKAVNRHPNARVLLLDSRGESWDGSHVFVMTAATPLDSYSIAEINADADGKGPAADSARACLSLAYQIAHALNEAQD
jgi:hypothetical protein